MYLKLSPSNYTIKKLICGTKNPASLTNGGKLNELKLLRNNKLAGCVQGQDGDEWQQDGQADGSVTPTKKRRVAPTTVDIQVEDVTVTLLCPHKRAQSSDLMVKVEATMLTAVFDFLQADCEACLPTRTYTRSGKFSKKQKMSEEDTGE